MTRFPCDPGLPNATPTEAYWQFPTHALASHQSAKLPSETSVVIIGSGITGTSIAYHLLQASPKLEIVLLEARTITSGATGRNGGHCKDVPFKTYKKWKADFGRPAAERLVRFRGSHVEATRKMALQLQQEGIADAQFRNVESVTAVFDPAIFQELKSNMEDWLEDSPHERANCSTVSGAEAEQKYGIYGASGVLSLPAAALWPYRLVTGILAKLLREYRGFSVEAHTPVTSITASGDEARPYAVRTPRGAIHTSHVIHCTNGHAAHLLPALQGKIIPVRGQMTALIPSPAFPRLGHVRSWSMYWPNGGFDYMTQAGNAEGYVFLGGGVEQGTTAGVIDLNCTSDGEINEPALKHLCEVLPKHFKGGDGTRLKQAWTGVMGFTPDNFPIVGRLPRELSAVNMSKNASGSEWIAAGFNGYGMVHCWQSGRAIADMILNRPREQIDEWFPREQFECSVARLKRMDYESMKSTWYLNAPQEIRSRL